MRSYQRSFASAIFVFGQRCPAVEIGQRRDPHHAFGQRSRRRRKLFGEQITPLRTSTSSSGLSPVELVAVVEEDDRLVVAQVARAGDRARRSSRRTTAGRPTLDRPRLTSSQQPHRFEPAGRREHVAALELACRRRARRRARARPSTAIRSTPARSRSSPPRSLNSPHQVLEDQPHAGQRPGQPFQEDAAEHDAELPEVHVVLAGVAVEHQRAEEHLDQQRIADDLARRPRGPSGRAVAGPGRRSRAICADAAARSCRSAPGNCRATSARKQLEVVVELAARRRETRSPSRPAAQSAKSSQRNPQLPQQPGQRARFVPLGREVGHGVQADVVVAAAEPVERVQPADRVVPLEHADALVVVGQANAGRQPRHAGADDDRVVHATIRRVEVRETSVNQIDVMRHGARRLTLAATTD